MNSEKKGIKTNRSKSINRSKILKVMGKDSLQRILKKNNFPFTKSDNVTKLRRRVASRSEFSFHHLLDAASLKELKAAAESVGVTSTAKTNKKIDRIHI